MTTFRAERLAPVAIAAAVLTLVVATIAVRQYDDDPGGLIAPGSHLLSQVERTPLGILAVGARAEGRDRMTVSVFAAEGGRWDDVGRGLENGSPRALAADDRTAVVVGATGDGRSQVWWRAGTSRAWAPALRDAPPGELTGAVSTERGFVAVGYGPAGTGTAPIALRSDTGREWSASAIPFGGDSATIMRVAAGPHGVLAVGAVSDGGESQPAAWWSTDGHAWSDPALLAPGHGGSVFAVAAGRGGFVAMGRHRYRPAAWTSPDGRTWRRHPLVLPDLGGEPFVTDIAALRGGGYVATVRVTSLGDEQRGAVLRSDDGASWKAVGAAGDGADGGGYSDVYVDGDTAHVLGARRVGGRVHAFVEDLAL